MVVSEPCGMCGAIEVWLCPDMLGMWDVTECDGRHRAPKVACLTIREEKYEGRGEQKDNIK